MSIDQELGTEIEQVDRAAELPIVSKADKLTQLLTPATIETTDTRDMIGTIDTTKEIGER